MPSDECSESPHVVLTSKAASHHFRIIFFTKHVTVKPQITQSKQSIYNALTREHHSLTQHSYAFSVV